MWARTTLRHTLRSSLPFAQGKLHLSSSVGLSFIVPVSMGLAARAMSSTRVAADAGSPRLAECTRWLVHDASSGAARECPTPLVLLRTPRLSYAGVDAAHDESYRAWADTFAARGYTAVEVDVSVDPHAGSDAAGAGYVNGNAGNADGHLDGAPGPSFPEPIATAKSALNAQLRLLNIPFAPIVVASGPAGLVAQAYVSDHAASGLVLVAPPPDADPRHEEGKGTWRWPSFNYEPRFPILLMPDASGAGAGAGADMEAVSASRVGQAAQDGVGRGGRGVSIEAVVDGVRGDKTRVEIERWMDRCGF